MQKLSSDHNHLRYYGSYYGISETYNCFKIDICPDFLLAGLAASGAAAFFWIYQAITVKAAGRRKNEASKISLHLMILIIFLISLLLVNSIF